MPPGTTDRAVTLQNLIKPFLIAAVITAGFLMMMGGARLSDDQINYVAIAERILDPAAPVVSWVPYRTFSFLLAGLFGLTGDHILSLKVIFAAVSFLYLIGMARFLGIFLKNKPAVWAATVISMTPGYTLGMTFWGFGQFELILARTVFMALAPWVLWLFWDPAPRRRALSLILCALGTILSMEAMLLLAIMGLCMVLQFMLDKKVRAQAAGVLGWGMAVAALIGIVVYYIPVFYQRDIFFTQAPIYQSMIEANRAWVQALAPAAFVDLFWEAAYACCWWTLFPPRLSDLLFALANQGLLIGAAVLGWSFLRRSGGSLAGRWGLWTLCVIAVAYGYPLARFVGWKLLDLPPHIFEEVRAFKFFHPLLFVCAGLALDRLWQGRRRAAFAALTAILCVAPLGVLQSIPADWKSAIHDLAARYVTDPEKLGYVAKALALRDGELDQDLGEIRSILEERTPQDAFVLSTQYPLRLSGRNLIALYNDKRNGYLDIDGETYARLPYWYVSYKEISEASDTCDEEQLIQLARKYGCDFAAVPCSFSGSRWETLYSGRRVSLYRLNS